MKRLLLALCIALLWASLPSNAQAQNKRQFSYEFKKVWPTVVRFIRIDEGLKITEKDVETGYVVFEQKYQQKTYTGSVELVPTTDSKGRNAVTVRIRLPKRPSYIADSMVDKLARKLRDDLGAPPAPPKPPPAKATEEEKEKEEKNGSSVKIRDKP